MPHGPYSRVGVRALIRAKHVNELQAAVEDTYSTSEIDTELGLIETSIPVIVTDALADSETVIDAAEAAAAAAAPDAVTAEIAARDILEGADISDAAGEPDFAFTFADVLGYRSFLEGDDDGGPSAHATELIAGRMHLDPTYDSDMTGIALALGDEDGNAGELEIGTDGKFTDRVMALWASRLNDTTGIAKDRVWLTDAIHEWWIGPLYVWTDAPYSRLLGGAISTTGQQLITESVPGAGSRSVVINTTDPDDHSVPTPFLAGDRVCAIITEHDRTTTFGVVVGNADGSIDSLAQNPITTITPVVATTLAYAQVFALAHLDTSTTRTFWSFSRTNDSWTVTEFEIDLDDGSVTSNFSRKVVIHTGNQVYMSIADAYATGNQTLRIAFGYNPNANQHDVYYLEVNTVTGAITSPFESISGSPNIRTNTALPISAPTLIPMLDDVAADEGRRMAYVRPGPYKPGVVYAEWADATPDAATYAVADIEPDDSITVTEYGTAGPRVGYIEGSNYIAMGCFPNPCYDNTVVWARRDAGNTESTLEVHRTDRNDDPVVNTIATSAHPIIRPYWPRSPFGVLYSDVTYYSPTSYTTYVATIKSAKEDR